MDAEARVPRVAGLERLTGLRVDRAVDPRHALVRDVHEAHRAGDDVPVRPLAEANADGHRFGNRERAQRVEPDVQVRVVHVDIEQPLVDRERPEGCVGGVEHRVRRVRRRVQVRVVVLEVELEAEAVLPACEGGEPRAVEIRVLAQVDDERVVQALRDVVQPRRLQIVGPRGEGRLPLHVVGPGRGTRRCAGDRVRRAGAVVAGRVHQEQGPGDRQRVRPPDAVAVDEAEPWPGVLVAREAEQVEQDPGADVARVRGLVGQRECVDHHGRPQGVRPGPGIGQVDGVDALGGVLEEQVQPDAVLVDDGDEVPAAVLQAADGGARRADGVADGLAALEPVGRNPDRVGRRVHAGAHERQVPLRLRERRREDVPAVVADLVEERPVVRRRGAVQVGEDGAHQGGQLARAHRGPAERVRLLEEQHLAQGHRVGEGAELRPVELDVVVQRADGTRVEDDAHVGELTDQLVGGRLAVRDPLDAQVAVELCVVAGLEDGHREIGPAHGDRHRGEVHLRVELLERLELVEVDPGGVLDRGDDHLLDDRLDGADRRLEGLEDEAHRRQDEVVDQPSHVGDGDADVPDRLRQAEHREDAGVQERVVEAPVAVGVVKLGEEDVEEPDLGLCVSALRVDPVVRGQLVLPVASRRRVDQDVRARESEPSPFRRAGVDVPGPLGEVGANEGVGGERVGVRRVIAVGEDRDHLGQQLVERLVGGPAEGQERVIDGALEDEEHVEERAAVAAHDERLVARGGLGERQVLVDDDRPSVRGDREDRELPVVRRIAEAE